MAYTGYTCVKVAVYLASDESRMVTGHVLPVDRLWSPPHKGSSNPYKGVRS
jgi:hypothetical protein